MNIDKFTTHSKNIISAAQGIAAKNDHQQLLPLHLLAALLADDTGVINNLISICEGDLHLLDSNAEQELAKIPKVQVQGGGQVYFSSEALKTLEKAASLAASNNDSFITIERILEALTFDNGAAGKILK